MKKRGAIAVQLHWVFIAIAGALILLFFINIVLKQKDVSDISISSTVITDIDAILTGASVSSGTVNIFDIPKYDIGFECNTFSIGPVKKQVQDRLIFSSDLIRGDQVIAWSLDWNVPYRTANFLYLTTAQVRYIVVDDSSPFAGYVYNKLPDEINKELVSNLATIKNLNDYRVRFVFFTDPTTPPPPPPTDYLDAFNNIPNKDISAVWIKKDAANPQMIGKISYYTKQGSSWSLVRESEDDAYFTEQGLMAAIYSSDYDMYKCGMQKAFNKLNKVSDIYQNRSEKIKAHYSPGTNCNSIHSDASSLLRDMVSNSAQFNPGNANQLLQVIIAPAGLKHQNELAKLKSCALIY